MVYLEHFTEHPLDYITEFYTAERVRIFLVKSFRTIFPAKQDWSFLSTCS